jgi:hypothetical protein
MKVTYNIDKNDLLAFSKYYIYSDTKRKIYNEIFFALAILYLITDALLPKILDSGVMSLDFYDFLRLLISLSFFIIIYYLVKKIILYFTKRAFNKGNYNANIWNINFEILDNYIYVKWEHSESKINLDVVIKICENEKYFFLYVTSSSALVIPKFKIEWDSKELFEFLRKI